MIMKFPDKPMYTIYGLAHLLRFISKHYLINLQLHKLMENNTFHIINCMNRVLTVKLPKLFDILSSVKNEFVPNALHFVNGLFV